MRRALRGALALSCLASACAAPRERAAPIEPPELACTCGTAEAEILGCPCDACLSGAGEPSNVACACAEDDRAATSAFERLEQARAMLEAGRLARARELYARALREDPGLAPLAEAALVELEQRRAAALDELARSARDEGRLELAREAWIEVLVAHRHSAAAPSARAALAELDERDRAARAGWRASRPDELLRLLRPAVDELERALEQTARGRTAAESSLTRAIVHLEAARTHGERAAEATAGLEVADDPALARCTAELAARLQAARVEADLTLARLYVAAGALVSARASARAALEIDPARPGTWAFQARLEAAGRREGWWS